MTPATDLDHPLVRQELPDLQRREISRYMERPQRRRL